MTTPSVTTASELVLLRADDDHLGLRFEGDEWTWREVVAEAKKRAALLQRARRDGPFHVGVLLENTAEYLFLLAGAALCGAVVVGINPTRRGEQLAEDIRKTDCQLVVTDSTMRHLLDGLDLEMSEDRILVADRDAYRSELEEADTNPMAPVRPAPEDLYLLIFTSGSTGGPKAVRMTQGRAGRASQGMPFGHDDVLYCAMPLFHGNALSASVLPAFAGGATLVLRRRFSASSFLDDVREHGATFFNTVGRAIAYIVATPPTEHDRDHRLKFVLGPETSTADKAEFTERFGVPIFEGYGSSENAIVIRPMPGAGPGALGKASDSDDVAVVDPDTGEERPRARLGPDGRLLNPDEAIGEIVGRRALGKFEGYYNNPEAEAERSRNGWYWSGDLALPRRGRGLLLRGPHRRLAPCGQRELRRGTGRAHPRSLGGSARGRRLRRARQPHRRPGDGRTGARARCLLRPAGFDDFLVAQPDLGTKWGPRYVRIVESIPVTATNKVDKKPLRAARWRTDEPMWHRPAPGLPYRPMTAEDVAGLEKEFAVNGRSNLLGK